MTIQDLVLGRPETEKLLREMDQLPMLVQALINTALLNPDRVCCNLLRANSFKMPLNLLEKISLAQLYTLLGIIHCSYTSKYCFDRSCQP